MLLPRHGASKAGTALSSSAANAMTSFNGTNALASDAMRAFTARAHRAGENSNPSRRSIHNLWNPSHGIVFASPAQDARRLNTSSISGTQTPTDTIDTSYLSIASERNHAQLSAQSSSDGSNWVPSSSGSASTTTGGSQAESGTRNGAGEIAYPRLPTTTSTPSASQEAASTETQNERPTKEAATAENGAEPEYTPLPFSIPIDVFEKAKAAPEGHPDSFWTHKLYTNPSDPATKIKVHYCKSLHTTETVLQKHFLGKPVLGFDIEWKMDATRYSSPKKNVSLIQIACEDRIILSHIGLFPKDNVQDLVAPTLRAIMEDENVLKCGVAIKADCTRLRKYLNIDSKGVFELSHLHKLVTYSASGEHSLINKKLVSLTQQASTHLGLPIFKGEVRGSDWSEALSMEQILYAASDAYAGLAIFDQLEQKRLALEPTPPRPYAADLNKPIRLASGVEIKAEPTEDAEEEAPRKVKVDAPHQPFAENLDIEVDPSDCVETDVADTPTTNAAAKKTKPEPKEVDPIVEAAAQFALKYRATYPKTAATPAQLRAYHIWASQPSLSVEDIAAKLRDPPLQVGTVVNYILEAVRTEGRGITGSVAWLVDPLKLGGGMEVRGIEVDKGRLGVLMERLPEGTRGTWRWKGLWKSVEGRS